MKIKVLHVVLSLGTGGLENGVINIVNGIDRDKFEIDVVCLFDSGALAKRISNSETNVYFQSKTKNSIAASVLFVRKLCRINQYDIIHTHGWATLLAGYLATRLLFNAPIILNGEHGTLYFSRLRQRLTLRYLFNRVALNLSVSMALSNEICRRYRIPKENFKVIHNGVNSRLFQPDAKLRNVTRKSISLAENDLLLGSVGRLVEVKNYPSLIRAFSIILEECPAAKLLLVGDGPEEQNLRNLAEELDVSTRVIFLGRRDNVAALMSILDVFILPSFREGMSNTVLEAMSSGLPVVTTNTGGNPEIVAHGETGYLFEVDDIDGLAGRLKLLLSSDATRRKIGANAREYILSNHSLEVMVSNYENTYQQLLEKCGVRF